MAVKRFISEHALSEQAAALMVRRERIATAVLSGLAAGGNMPDEASNAGVATPIFAAEVAVMWTDALIAELDRDPEAGA